MCRLGLPMLVVTLVWADDLRHDCTDAVQSQGEKEDTNWYYISAAVLFGVVIVFIMVILFLFNLRYLVDKIKNFLCPTYEKCVPVKRRHKEDEYKQSLMSPGYSCGSLPE